MGDPRPRLAIALRFLGALSLLLASACASHPATAPPEPAPAAGLAPAAVVVAADELEPPGSNADSVLDTAPDAVDEATEDDFDDEFEDDFDDQFELLAPDPLEPVNRGVFRGNRVLDRFVLEPIARGYGWVVPDPAKRSVRNFFENLNQPAVMVNDLLQLEGRRAGTAGTRFLVNSTVGVVGLFDPAQRFGFEAHHADFGQTLGKAGLGPGVYLVVPVLGPSTSRDLVGGIVDLALRPDTWLLPLSGNLLVGGTLGISLREEVQEQLNALESTSVDFYAAIRSAYLMRRAALVRDVSDDPVEAGEQEQAVEEDEGARSEALPAAADPGS